MIDYEKLISDFGLEHTVELCSLKLEMKDLISYVKECKALNNEEWMEGLVLKINKSLEIIGSTLQVKLKGSEIIWEEKDDSSVQS